MSDLATLQARFAAALNDPTQAAALATALAGPPERSLRRLEIYRSTLRANHAKALLAAFPIVAKIVGNEFFDGLAREYGRQHPSASGDLNEYGERFAEFLCGFPPAHALPYLGDVARLEWRVHRAHHAADVELLDPARLGEVPPVNRARIKLVLHSAVATLKSAYPLAAIWEVHQPEYSGEFSVDLTPAEHYALVFRPEYTVCVAALARGEDAFLGALAQGERLGAAVDAALARDPQFDFSPALTRWLSERVIVGFFL